MNAAVEAIVTMTADDTRDPQKLRALEDRLEQWATWRRKVNRVPNTAKSPDLLGRLAAEKAEAKRRSRKCPNVDCNGQMKRKFEIGLVCGKCGCTATPEGDRVYANLVHGQGYNPGYDDSREMEMDAAIAKMPGMLQRVVQINYTDWRTQEQKARALHIGARKYRYLLEKGRDWLLAHLHDAL